MSVHDLVLEASVKEKLDLGFETTFGRKPQFYFSAPGRTEIGGNHTDHQAGRVLASAVNRDTLAAVRINGSRVIRVLSEGYPVCQVDLRELTPVFEERNTTAALVRGAAAGFIKFGYRPEGFDAYCTSTVLPGSGLSSSAAFEVLMGTVMNSLFCRGEILPQQIASIGQYAENEFFGKPCGLMDQMASAMGGLVSMDFADPDRPKIRRINFDFSTCGYALCIINTGAGHENLTDQYAAIPGELKQLCACFGKKVITQVPEEDFYGALADLRRTCGDRGVLRAIHEYEENRRVDRQVEALEQGRFHEFLRLVRESGRSSWMYLQNVIPQGGIRHQDMAVTLALCEKYLGGRGACRVHGGGFAGTVQAFVPTDLLDTFRQSMDAVLGQGACQVLTIRPQGAMEIPVARSGVL